MLCALNLISTFLLLSLGTSADGPLVLEGIMSLGTSADGPLVLEGIMSLGTSADGPLVPEGINHTIVSVIIEMYSS